MRAFRDIPFHQKLMATILVTVGLVLVLSAAGVVVVDTQLYRRNIDRDLAAVAQMSADNLTAAVAFNDAISARETLAALRAKPHMEAACVYLESGQLLATYVRTGEGRTCPSATPAESESAGVEVTRLQPVVLRGRRIGTVFLMYDLAEVYTRRKLYFIVVGFVLLASGILALMISSRMQKAIMRPISNLAAAAKSVSETRDYGIRARKISGDELGLLADAFNEMLANIQSRDVELRRAGQELEQRVLARTEELRQSEERFRALIEGVGDYAIFILDPQGKIASWNAGAERIKQYKASEIIGQHFSRFYPPEIPRTQMDQNLKTAETQGRWEDEGWRVRKDGTRFWAGVVITALRDSEGKLVGFSKITRDLTERRRAEEALRRHAEDLARSNADLQQFAYVASHDLQEPLRMVISYLQIIADRYGPLLDADGHEFLNFAVDGGYRMRQLITDLLEYSRVGTRHSNTAPADCNAILDDVRANLDLAIREASAEVTSSHLPTVTADPALLLQLLQNLVSNAIKFRGKQPAKIHVAAKREERAWIFSVADNGIGIDPKHRQAIFEIFRRLHDRMEYPGTGIGLAVCKKIVERLGGRIWVESEPGQGATFFFTIADAEERES